MAHPDLDLNSMRVRLPRRCSFIRLLGFVVWLACVCAALLNAGCGLTGGGIPSGPGIGGGGVTNPTPTGEVLVVGRVQSAITPYDPIAAASVSVAFTSGQTVASARPVNVDGSFAIPNLPTGDMVLTVTAADPNLPALSLPFRGAGTEFIQFVAAPPPAGSPLPASLSLQPDTTAPSLSQQVFIHASVGGQAPLTAPSWIAFGNIGHLSAAGPVARLTIDGVGAEHVYAIAGSTLANVTLKTPSSQGGSGGSGSGGSQSGGSGSNSGGSGSGGSGSGTLIPS